MPIKIEITGEHVGDVRLILAALNAPDPLLMPLDDLMAITRARFNEAGFGVAISQQNPTLAQEEKPTAAEAEAIVAGIETALAAKTPRKKTSAKTKDAAPDPAAAAESIKNYVVGEMIQRFGDPRQKLKAKAFIDRVTGRHGGVRLSLLDPALFPEIKLEMESEFNIAPSNGAGGEAHA